MIDRRIVYELMKTAEGRRDLNRVIAETIGCDPDTAPLWCDDDAAAEALVANEPRFRCEPFGYDGEWKATCAYTPPDIQWHVDDTKARAIVRAWLTPRWS